MYCLILSCTSIYSTLCIVWDYHVLVFIAHYVLFEISSTNFEALSIQVNALNLTWWPLTLTLNNFNKLATLKIILPIRGVKINGDFFLHQSDTKAWDDDDVGSTSHVTFFLPGCLITWWNHLIVWTTIDLGNAIFLIGLKKIFLITDDVINLVI